MLWNINNEIYKVKGSKSIVKINDNPIDGFIVIFGCCIELSAPIIVYGLQIVFLFLYHAGLFFNEKDLIF